VDDTVSLMMLLVVAVGAGTAAAGFRPRAKDPRRWVLAAVGAAVMLGLLCWFGFDGASSMRLGLELAEIPAVAVFGAGPVQHTLFLLALVWCGPPADLVVRAVLSRTGLPAPEAAAASGVGAGRWIGRLERWSLLAVIAAGVPALAFLPTTAKAALRYAEVSAEDRVQRSAPTDPIAAAAAAAKAGPGRHQLLEYVVVESLASWGQAIILGVVVAG
jgi:hypothetical protein